MLLCNRPLFALLLLWGSALYAAPQTNDFIDDYCANCHDSDEKKGGLDLTNLAWDLEKRGNFDEWVKVVDYVTKGEMPPKKKARPEAAAVQVFLDAIGNELRSYQGEVEAKQGRAILRRLNRVEYERTVQDLLRISIPLAGLLPADTPMHGFDTVAEGLRLSTLQMERYLDAADTALDAAITFAAEPEHMSKRAYFKDEKGIRKDIDTPEGTLDNPTDPKSKHRQLLLQLPDDSIVFFNPGYPTGDTHQLEQHPAGGYRVRISGYAYQSPGKPVIMRVYDDNYREKDLIGWFEMPPDQPRVVEFTSHLKENSHLRIESTYVGSDGKGGNIYNKPVKEFTGAGLALQWAELEGPFLASWPPPSMKILFGDIALKKIEDPKKHPNRKNSYELVPDDPRADAKREIERFAARAFRRPLVEGEADRFVKLVDDELDSGTPFTDAMRVGFRGILTAPQFLLFQEAPGKLDDSALASRLSYFLWSTMPDEELLAAAAEKKLSDPQVLHAQVERMLKDKRSSAFVKNFTGQWLDLRNIDATTPDPKLYPESDELLRVSMVQETEKFFAEMLEQNLSYTNIVQSDFAILNSRLALHYGIGGVQGEEFRKVSLPAESPRGGLITQASILKVTANGTTTSPVLRGAWIMKKILGQPPQPPPPGTGTIEPDTRGATTVREQLAKHRTQEICAGCHSKIDPPGFALESFDVIGGYREAYRSQDKGKSVTIENCWGSPHYIKLGLPVDASGELPDGRTFSGIRDYKQLLLSQSEPILSSLAEKLVIYSSGAGITFADRPAVAAIVEKTKAQGGGLRTLIHEVVQSAIFQNK